MSADQQLDLPITALCILSDKLNCPARYTAIERGYDTKTDVDLWKDGLFGRKTNRFICFTKEFPIGTTYNVVEDMKLFNEGDNVPQGYIALDKTDDLGVFFISLPFCRNFETEEFNCFSLNKLGEKAFRGKVLHAKISLRFYTDIAISDIVILVKQKRAPPGYSLVGAINNHTLCVRYSKVPKQQNITPPRLQENTKTSGDYAPIQMPTPYGKPNTDVYKTAQRIFDSATHYNPLQGVPFEINPIYAKNSNTEYYNADVIEKYSNMSNILNKVCTNIL